MSSVPDLGPRYDDTTTVPSCLRLDSIRPFSGSDSFTDSTWRRQGHVDPSLHRVENKTRTLTALGHSKFPFER